MHQNWGKLLFMHWAIDAELLRPLIPSQLSIDTFDGHAWIGVVPFTMWGIRASFLPAIPGTSAFHELNVRTYVHFNGVPGVWFFSLDAANSLAVWGARTFYHLPYFNAEMSLEQEGKTINYSSKRIDQRGSPAEFQATWNIGEPFAAINAGLARILSHGALLPLLVSSQSTLSLAHFSSVLAAAKAELVSATPARAGGYRSTMIQALGIPEPVGEPLLHYAESIAVDIWPLKRVGRRGASSSPSDRGQTGLK